MKLVHVAFALWLGCYSHSTSATPPCVGGEGQFERNLLNSDVVVAATAKATSIRQIDKDLRQTVLWEVNESWKGSHLKGSTFTTRTYDESSPVIMGQAFLLYLKGKEPYDASSCDTRSRPLQDSLQDIGELYKKFNRFRKKSFNLKLFQRVRASSTRPGDIYDQLPRNIKWAPRTYSWDVGEGYKTGVVVPRNGAGSNPPFVLNFNQSKDVFKQYEITITRSGDGEVVYSRKYNAYPNPMRFSIDSAGDRVLVLTLNPFCNTPGQFHAFVTHIKNHEISGDVTPSCTTFASISPQLNYALFDGGLLNLKTQEISLVEDDVYAKIPSWEVIGWAQDESHIAVLGKNEMVILDVEQREALRTSEYSTPPTKTSSSKTLLIQSAAGTASSPPRTSRKSELAKPY